MRLNKKEKVKKAIEEGRFRVGPYYILQDEFLTNSYELLKKAAGEAEYSEPETMAFVVKADENDLFAMEDGQIIEFIMKIMGLYEIQD